MVFWKDYPHTMYRASKPFERAIRAVKPSKTPGQTTIFVGSFNNSLKRCAPVNGTEAIFYCFRNFSIILDRITA